eukprot:scaffold706_cov190-Alexandrium_tamarense.AAC.5
MDTWPLPLSSTIFYSRHSLIGELRRRFETGETTSPSTPPPSRPTIVRSLRLSPHQITPPEEIDTTNQAIAASNPPSKGTS